MAPAAADPAPIGLGIAGLEMAGGYKFPPSQTPWQDIERALMDQLSCGMVLKSAVKFQRIAQTFGVPRDNHLARGDDERQAPA